MTSKEVFAVIRKRAILIVIIGALSSLIMGFLCFCCAFNLMDGQYDSSDIYVTVFMACITLFSIVILIVGILNANPRTSYVCYRNPDLFQQVDELYANEIYKDKNVVCSEKNIADVGNILGIAAFDEILGAYVEQSNGKYNQDFNRLARGRVLILATVKGDVHFKLRQDSPNEIEKIKKIILDKNSNVRWDPTPEDITYIKQMKKQYAAKRRS